MTIYRILDGKQIYASDATEFVTNIRNSSMYPCNDINAYMAEFAKRVYLLYGNSIQFNDANEFLSELIRLNIVYIVPVN